MSSSSSSSSSETHRRISTHLKQTASATSMAAGDPAISAAVVSAAAVSLSHRPRPWWRRPNEEESSKSDLTPHLEVVPSESEGNGAAGSTSAAVTADGAIDSGSRKCSAVGVFLQVPFHAGPRRRHSWICG
jgi:hypothetical protein